MSIYIQLNNYKPEKKGFKKKKREKKKKKAMPVFSWCLTLTLAAIYSYIQIDIYIDIGSLVCLVLEDRLVKT